MKLSDKQKAFLKKLAVWLLRIAGSWLLLSLLWIAGGCGICKTVKAIKVEAKNEPV